MRKHSASYAAKPDIVLSDWSMPKMNGMALLQALKSEGIEVPFGFVTSEQVRRCGMQPQPPEHSF